MRIFTLSLVTALFLSASTLSANAQCPTPTGMVATSLQLNSNCYLFVQFAIPNSIVSIYNASGYVAQAAVSNTGTVLVPFACSAAPITAVVSIDGSGNTCATATISSPILLPVKFISFNADIVSAGVNLKWTTSYELNNDKYIVEKSNDGRTYTAIGEIAGLGNSLDIKNYQFADNSFREGDAAYYRLRQVDFDGRSSYSKVIYVSSEKTGTHPVSLFPNPFMDEIQIRGMSSADINKSTIRLYNVAGAQVSYQLSGANAIRVDPSLPAGLYLLRINGNSYKIMKN